MMIINFVNNIGGSFFTLEGAEPPDLPCLAPVPKINTVWTLGMTWIHGFITLAIILNEDPNTEHYVSC